MEATRRAYPSDVTDDEWAFLLPYLLLVREDAGKRQYPLRELFNALALCRTYRLHLAVFAP